MAFADGCIDECAEQPSPESGGYRAAYAALLRQEGGRGLFAEFDVVPSFPDLDGDGVPDSEDEDLDGDGIPNSEDDDVDGDGVPDDEDDDIDQDGIPDDEDDDIAVVGRDGPSDGEESPGAGVLLVGAAVLVASVALRRRR